MDNQNSLENEIMECRRVSSDRGTVIYDIGAGVNFSNPKESAKALAQVLFTRDISGWISNDGKNLTVKPPYKIEIKMNGENKKALEKIEKDFNKYLGFDDIESKYLDFIQKNVDEGTDAISVLFLGIWAFLFKHIENKSAEKEYIKNLMETIMKNVEIV